MQVTIAIDELMLRQVAERALASAFYASTDRYGDNGAGAKAIQKQVNEWAAAQDYRPMIEELAPAIFADAVRDALSAAIRKEAQRVWKQMKETGEVGDLFEAQP